jgi:hypothetical protein
MQATAHRGQLATWAKAWQNRVWPLRLGLERSSSSVRPWRHRLRTAPFRRALRAKFKRRGNIWICVLLPPRSMFQKRLLHSHRCRVATVLAPKNRFSRRRWALMACDRACLSRTSCNACIARDYRSRDCLKASQRCSTWASVQKASRACGSCKRHTDNPPPSYRSRRYRARSNPHVSAHANSLCRGQRHRA